MRTLSYNFLSITFSLLACIAFLLVMRELPNNDGVDGDYINILMSLVETTKSSAIEMRPMPFFAITEARIVTTLFIISIACALSAILFGVIARRRKESSIGHAGSITLSALLLLSAFEYKWIHAW